MTPAQIGEKSKVEANNKCGQNNIHNKTLIWKNNKFKSKKKIYIKTPTTNRTENSNNAKLYNENNKQMCLKTQ